MVERRKIPVEKVYLGPQKFARYFKEQDILWLDCFILIFSLKHIQIELKNNRYYVRPLISSEVNVSNLIFVLL